MKKLYFVFALIICISYIPEKAEAQLPASIGNYNVTSIVDTLANIYIADIEKDLDIYFFERFAQLLNNFPEIRILFPATTIYLSNIPNYQYTTMLSTLRIAFNKDLKKLPADLAAIPNLDTAECCNSARVPHTCKNRIGYIQSKFNTDKGRLAVAALLMVDGAMNKTAPPKILNDIATNKVMNDDITDTISNIIKLLNTFSVSLLSEQTPDTWMSFDEWKIIRADPGEFIQKLVTNIESQHIWLGDSDISVVLSRHIHDDSLKIYIDTLVITGNNLIDNIQKLRDGDTIEKNRVANMVNFVIAFKKFFNTATNYRAITKGIPIEKKQTAAIYADINNSLDIVKDLLVKDYKSAVFTGMVLVDSLMSTKECTNFRGKVHVRPKTIAKKRAENSRRLEKQMLSADILQDYVRRKKDIIADKQRLTPEDKSGIALTQKNITEAQTHLQLINDRYGDVMKHTVKQTPFVRVHLKHLMRRDIRHGRIESGELYRKYHTYADSKTTDKVVKHDLEQQTLTITSFKQNFLKYGTLLACVVDADSPDQILNAFESVAEPPGSSIVKKTANFSIALQGYGGISTGFGATQIDGNIFKNANSLNPYAPLGISISTALKRHGNTSNKTTWGAVSLFFSVIDIGAVVNYNLRNKSAQTADTVAIKLANIFAPGVNVVYGIPGVPLSVGAGFQYQPMLSTSEEGSLIIKDAQGYRWQVFAAFDLSFINLYISKK